ncbi:hypothetical protein PIB30_050136, partial [Stylosanthes scabra]|nr:hypothetical protein [Stylosanthes scabra]
SGIDDWNEPQRSIKFSSWCAQCRVLPHDGYCFKGAPKTRNTKFKQIRRCSNCGVIGHYNRSCSNYDGPSQDGSLAADGRVKSSNSLLLRSRLEQRRKRKVSNVSYEDSDESWEKVVDTKGGKKKRS